MKYVLLVPMMVLVAAVSMAGDGNAYLQYRKLIDDQQQDAAVRNRTAQEFLRSLSRDGFLAFVRDVARQPGYDDRTEGHILAMTVFAKAYVTGPGHDEALHTTLDQFSDPTLPLAWKTGLLDVLDLENREDLTTADVALVITRLHEMGLDKQNDDAVRFFYLGKLGSFLYSQRELITQKAPDVEDALDKQDRTALPKRDDANVRQAAKLIDAIRDYKATLQKTADEVKDEQIKANLKKRLAKWKPITVGDRGQPVNSK